MFDHGAQYFTARDARFRRCVESWKERGIVAEWTGRIDAYDAPGTSKPTGAQERLVGVPSMNAIAKHLACELDVQTQVRVARVQTAGSRYELIDEDGQGLGIFDRVVVTAPPTQSAQILSEFSSLNKTIHEIEMNPCWAVLVALDDELPVPWQGAFVNLGPLRWIARNQTKPARDDTTSSDYVPRERIVLHASPEWSKQNLEESPARICEQLLKSLCELTQLDSQSISEPIYQQAHLWRYSIPVAASAQRCLCNEDNTLVACGDWAGGPRVEGAFLSGCAAAGRILGTLAPGKAKPKGQMSLF